MKKFNCCLLVAAMFVMMIGAFLPAAAAESNEDLTMKEDFLAWVQEDKYETRTGLTVDDVVFYDFGTYQNGRVVAIFIKDWAFTADEKVFEKMVTIKSLAVSR